MHLLIELSILDACVDCVQLDADSCVAAATRCLESIVRRFGGFVRDTLAAPVATGRVDLAREDRIARCREAHRVSATCGCVERGRGEEGEREMKMWHLWL